MPDSPALVGLSALSRGLLKVTIRIGTTLLIMVLAILCPSFDRVMALMGSAFCFTICIILPLLFYLKLFGSEIGMKERILDWFLIVVCSILAVVGTVWAFLPRGL
jgi:vesicular inhibitory amino acid transporter